MTTISTMGIALLAESEAKGAPNPLEVPVDLALFSLIAFLLLFLVLTKFGWKPIMAGLDKREQSIADQIEAAEQGAMQTEELLAEYKTKLAGADDEANSIIAQSKKEAEAQRQEILAEANEEAQRQRDRAFADIQAAKDQAMQELAEKSVNSAVSLARNLIGKEVDQGLHEKLIKDSLERFGSQN